LGKNNIIKNVPIRLTLELTGVFIAKRSGAIKTSVLSDLLANPITLQPYSFLYFPTIFDVFIQNFLRKKMPS